MDKDEFIRHFKRISESHKRDISDVTSKGRAKIGKIGIGFIAANEICDVMEIVSTKAGSDELLEVSIRFDLMREDPVERRRGKSEFAKGDYSGTISRTNSTHHFTKIFLKRVRGEAKRILAGAGNDSFTAGKQSLYGLSTSSIRKLLSRDSLKSWSEFDEYSQNVLHVGLNVPVRYHAAWLPKELQPELLFTTREAERADFALYVDGSQVLKPVVFAPSSGKTILSRFSYKGKNVKAEGYFYAQHGAIRPQELQGLLIRIRNAAVGEYDHSFLGFSSSIGPLFQSWISAEILADDRLEDAMNIDRRTLRVAHPAYLELQHAIHEHLSQLLGQVRKLIYGAGSDVRRETKAREIEDRIARVASQSAKSTKSPTAALIRREWEGAADTEQGRSRLLRKYSVAELYELVVEVATELLSSAQLERFLSRLTERLRK